MLLGIAGAPGSGKSTAAGTVRAEAERHGITAAVVPMDGFHLAHSTLERQGQTHVKGAPHTFDGDGFVALLHRVRAQKPGDGPIWAPEFRREIEDAIAGAIEVDSDDRLVIVEGNYLLLDESPWNDVPPLLDAAWMLLPDEGVRHARLIARHQQHGRPCDVATAHALGSDEVNAARVRSAYRTSARRGVIEVAPG